MKINKKIVSLSIVTILAIESLQGSNPVSDKLNSMFGNITVSNATGAGEWKDPSSGITYYSGGSMIVKFKNNTNFSPWIDARAPSIKTGCDGFSLDAGFASIIDLDGIADQLSAAGTSIVGGFISAIAYATPILGDIIEQVKAISDAITAMLQNACNIGKMTGSATKDFFIEKAAEEDTSKYVSDQKNKGDLETYLEAVGDKIQDLTAGMQCVGAAATSTDFWSCVDGKGADEDSASAIQVVLSDKIRRKVNLSSLVTSNIIKLNTRDLDKKSFTIDKMPLIDYMSLNTSKKSENGKFTPSPVLSNFGGQITQILFLLKEVPLANNAACTEIRNNFKYLKAGTVISAGETKEIMAKAGEESSKNFKTSPEKTKKLNIMIGNENTVFNPATDIFDFVQTGKVNNQPVLIENADIFVVQTIEGETNSTIAKQYTVLCSNEQGGNIALSNWNGLGSLSDVEDEIDKIAEDRPASEHNAQIPIVQEAAQLAKTLGKKRTLERNNVKIYAFSITERNIALLNNYIIISKIIDATENADSFLESSKGEDPGSIGSSENISGLEKLKELKEKYRDKLKEAYGTEEIFKAVLRDAKEVEDKYRKLRSQKTKQF